MGLFFLPLQVATNNHATREINTINFDDNITIQGQFGKSSIFAVQELDAPEAETDERKEVIIPLARAPPEPTAAEKD